MRFRCVERAIVIVLVALFACGDDEVFSGPEPAFPENYRETYTEVRNCRDNGGSHDFNRIRVLANPAALAAYRDREQAFPVGAVVLKEEYGSSDPDCSGEIKQWSVMERLPAGNEDQLNWRWQQVDFSRSMIGEDMPRCFGCHSACVEPDGYQGTCTVP